MKNEFDGSEWLRLIETMKILRSPGGCEWDIEQTHQSLKPYLIEEAYEVLDAIDGGDDKELVEELGDVLLQVVFHAQIAMERKAFTITDVLQVLTDKLIRRHPHVFSDSEGYSYRQWEEIKAKEKAKDSGKSSSIGEINKALPALSLARRVQENASVVGFDWGEIEGPREKLNEEIEELDSAIVEKDKKKIEEEIGDVLFTVTNLSRFLDVDPEVALRKSTEKFLNRFHEMESHIEKHGLDINNMTIDELNHLWEIAKEGTN